MSRWLRLDLDCLRAVGLFCIFMLLFAVAGCDTPERQDKTSYSVTDAEGTDVPILHKPQRILTIGASSDEMMLGLVEPERMAAINVSLANTEDSNIPWVRERILNIISRNPSVEEIAALQPDLVAVPEWLPKENVDAIRELNIPVVVFKSAATIGDIHENIRLFAAAVGEPERGEILIEKMEEKLAQIRKKIALVPEEKKYKSIALISIMPNYGGAGSTFDELCRYTDSVNAKAAAGNHMGQEMTKEQLVAANPDYLFFPSHENESSREENFGKQYLEDPSLAQMTAIQERRIGHPWARYTYNISQDIVFGIQETAWILYGDEFQQSRQEFLTAVE